MSPSPLASGALPIFWVFNRLLNSNAPNKSKPSEPKPIPSFAAVGNGVWVLCERLALSSELLAGLIAEVAELVSVLPVVLGSDDAVVAGGAKYAALPSVSDSKAGTRSLSEHPVSHAFDRQHPGNGSGVWAHVYHCAVIPIAHACGWIWL